MTDCQRVEEIFLRLLTPDNDTIQQATKELESVFKSKEIVPVLCQLISTSSRLQTKQYAAVLLRKKVKFRRHWLAMPEDYRASLKHEMLNALLSAKEVPIRRAVAMVVGTIAKHEFAVSQWPELLAFFSNSSTSLETFELGMFTLSAVCSLAAESMSSFCKDIIQLVEQGINQRDNYLIHCHSIKIVSHIAYLMHGNEQNLLKPLVPKLITIVQMLIANDESEAVECMEVFVDLINHDGNVVNSHIWALLDFAMTVGRNTELEESSRIKGLDIVSQLCSTKRKIIMKQNFVEPLLLGILPIMAEHHDDDDEQEEEGPEFNTEEDEHASSYASQVLDTMALHFPAKSFMPLLMKAVESGLQSSNVYEQRASMIAIAVSAQGCADHIRLRYMARFLAIVKVGLVSDVLAIRNAGLFALGQFAEHLQPEVSKACQEILPLVYSQLENASTKLSSSPASVARTYYALEMFCENLGKDIVPHLSTLMGRLLGILSSPVGNRTKELAFSAIGATAVSAEKEMLPFLPSIVELMRPCLVPDADGDAMRVQIQAIETLSILCKSLGSSFTLGNDCLQFSLSIVSTASDPDLRRCIYILFAALASQDPSIVLPHLPTIFTQLMTAVTSNDGINLHSEEGDIADIISSFNFEESDSVEKAGEDDDDDDDDNEICSYSVQNSYIEEKRDAIEVIGNLAAHLKLNFLPHVDPAFHEIVSLLQYPSPNIREASIVTLTEFCCMVSDLAVNRPELLSAQKNMLTEVIPSCVVLVEEDGEREVASAALESFKSLLEKCGKVVLDFVEDPPLEWTVSFIKGVFMHKIKCLGEEDKEEDEEEAELDSVVIEAAADVISSLIKAAGDGVDGHFVAPLIGELVRRTKSDIPEERSFGVGTLAEVMDCLKHRCDVYAGQMLPLFTKSLKDEEAEVRSNSVYALGVLASYSQSLLPKYHDILKSCSSLLDAETDRRVQDNICGAVCRMLSACPSAVPLRQVVPVVANLLPLKEDQEENATVAKAMCVALRTDAAAVEAHVGTLVAAFAHMLGLRDDPLKDEGRLSLRHCFTLLYKEFPELTSNSVNSLSPDSSAAIQTILAGGDS